MTIPKDIKNDVAHIFVGIASGFIAFLLFGAYSVYAAALTGLSMELYQFFGKSEPLWLADRLRDLTGYITGGVIIYYITRLL